MTTTRSTAEERRLKAERSERRTHTRSPEGVLLVSASVVALPRTHPGLSGPNAWFPRAEQQLKSKKLLNLNAVSSRAELIPFRLFRSSGRSAVCRRQDGYLRDNPQLPMSALWQKSECQPKKLTLLAFGFFRRRLAQLREGQSTREPKPDVAFPS